MALPEGFAYMAGRSRAKAFALIAAARAADVDVTEIRTVRDGYYVPQAVLDYIEQHNDDPELAIAIDSSSADNSFDPLNTKAEPYAPVSPAAKQPKGYTPSKAISKARAKAEAAAAAEEPTVEHKPAAEPKPAEELPPTEPPVSVTDTSGSAGQAPEVVVGEPLPEGTVITEENAGAVVDANGTEHVGEVPTDADAEPTTSVVVENIDETTTTETPAEPARNASRDDWVAYVRTLSSFEEADVAPLDDDDNPGLNRNDLVTKYGTYGTPVQVAE